MFELRDIHKPRLAALQRFMDEHVYPNEAVFERQHAALPSRWGTPPIVGELQQRARAEGLWNLFLPDTRYGAGLNNLDYAHFCEVMGRSAIAPEIFNCSAPDTGNMETLVL